MVALLFRRLDVDSCKFPLSNTLDWNRKELNHSVWFPIREHSVSVHFILVALCIVLITDDWINRNWRSNVTTFVNMVAAVPVGNFKYLILANPINNFLRFLYSLLLIFLIKTNEENVQNNLSLREKFSAKLIRPFPPSYKTSRLV